MENIKEVLSDVLKNYDELQRILRKTEYEIYIGELKSKLNNLYLTRTFRQSLFQFQILSFGADELIFPSDRKISELEVELENAKKIPERSEEIQDKIFSLFRSYINEIAVIDLKKESDETNILITENILQILENATKYQLTNVEKRIKKGRVYLAQMKDTQRKYDKIQRMMENVHNEEDINIKKQNYEKAYDETLDAIYEAELSIKDSKWLRVITYIGLLITLLALILTLSRYI